MKCPWRPVQTTTHFPGMDVAETTFADCYKSECPFYSPERKISENLRTAEHCRRTDREANK